MTKAIPAEIEALFRRESSRLISVLTRILGPKNLELAEDAMQDAFIAAMRDWERNGVPDNPSAWLLTAARRRAIDAIRRDPEWKHGEYTSQPPSLRVAESMLFFMGSNPVLRQAQMPTLAKADSELGAALEAAVARDDANDLLYAVEASEDYNPGPALETIRAPLLAVNSADDLINPPELGILEQEIRRVPHGRAVIVPYGPDTRGHGTHTIAAVWKSYLAELLAASASHEGRGTKDEGRR